MHSTVRYRVPPCNHDSLWLSNTYECCMNDSIMETTKISTTITSNKENSLSFDLRWHPPPLSTLELRGGVDLAPQWATQSFPEFASIEDNFMLLVMVQNNRKNWGVSIISRKVKSAGTIPEVKRSRSIPGDNVQLSLPGGGTKSKMHHWRP